MINRVKRVKKSVENNSSMLSPRRNVQGGGQNLLAIGLLSEMNFIKESTIISFGELPERYDKYENLNQDHQNDTDNFSALHNRRISTFEKLNENLKNYVKEVKDGVEYFHGPMTDWSEYMFINTKTRQYKFVPTEIQCT